MADSERENTFGFVDKRYDNKSNVGSLPGTLHSSVNYNDVATLRAALTSLNAGLYTAAKLNQMTKNDMDYAYRTLADPTGI